MEKCGQKARQLYPCVLEKGHAGACRSACYKKIKGRHQRLKPLWATLPSHCVLPKDHGGQCEDDRGYISCSNGEYSIFESSSGLFVVYNEKNEVALHEILLK